MMKELIIKIDEKGNIIESKPYVQPAKTTQRSLLGDIGNITTTSNVGIVLDTNTVLKLFLLFAMCVAFFLMAKKLTVKA